jgi:glycerol uptake facilitator-like aquaporin
MKTTICQDRLGTKIKKTVLIVEIENACFRRMNPARDLGPRLITLCAGWGGTALSSGWWVYTVGPLAGGVLGAFAYAATLGAAHKTNSKP